MVKFLLNEGVSQDLLRALGASAYYGDSECVKILMDFLEEHKIDFSSLKKTTAYTNHPHIKVLFDARIS
jgi:hypothetical protein